ncbi:hypothetical protein ACFW5I_28915 [Streptomyces sp. NPDC058818]|uniref:hypothetical protein n=1 Tax=Streptomyces sp. NPDC058818 TaxID=3346640 RepID=UPI00369FFC43
MQLTLRRDAALRRDVALRRPTAIRRDATFRRPTAIHRSAAPRTPSRSTLARHLRRIAGPGVAGAGLTVTE